MSFIANAFNALQLAGTNLWLCDCGTELETISVAPRITFLNMKKRKEKSPRISPWHRAPCFCPRVQRGWSLLLRWRKKVSVMCERNHLVRTGVWMITTRDLRRTIQQVPDFVQIDFEIWNLRSKSFQWDIKKKTWLTFESILVPVLYDNILWCETPGSDPWNKCSWRCLEQSWEWLPSCLGHGDSPFKYMKKYKQDSTEFQAFESFIFFSIFVQWKKATADTLFYLHCVCFARGCLPIGKYCPVVAFQNIWTH